MAATECSAAVITYFILFYIVFWSLHKIGDTPGKPVKQWCILFHNQILTFLHFILNAFIKSSSISSTGLPLSRNNDLVPFKHLISNRHSNSDNSKKRFCSFIAKSSFASTLYRKRGFLENVRLDEYDYTLPAC